MADSSSSHSHTLSSDSESAATTSSNHVPLLTSRTHSLSLLCATVQILPFRVTSLRVSALPCILAGDSVLCIQRALLAASPSAMTRTLVRRAAARACPTPSLPHLCLANIAVRPDTILSSLPAPRISGSLSLRRCLSSSSSASSLPSTMKAAVLVKAGSDFQMQLEDLQMPKPKRGEVLIRTKASTTHRTHEPSTRCPLTLPVPCYLLTGRWCACPAACCVQVRSVSFGPARDEGCVQVPHPRRDGPRDER